MHRYIRSYYNQTEQFISTQLGQFIYFTEILKLRHTCVKVVVVTIILGCFLHFSISVVWYTLPMRMKQQWVFLSA